VPEWPDFRRSPICLWLQARCVHAVAQGGDGRLLDTLISSETARSDASFLWQGLSAPLPLVGRGKGWGALSLQEFEKSVFF
jgi:hypothetical protein